MFRRILSPEWLYALYAIPMTLFLALAMPPFQNPDEIAHFLRADQIAGGEWLGHRPEAATEPQPPLFRLSDDLSFGLVPDRPLSGGNVDGGILELARLFTDMPFHPDRDLAPDTMRKAAAVGWTHQRSYAAFSNTVIYAPVLYVLPAATIALGRTFDLPVLYTLRLARLAAAMVVVAVAVLAIRLCRHGRWTMAALLALPMSLSMAAAVTQDGLVIACAALAAAVLSRHLTARTAITSWEWCLLVGAVSIISLARPPYLACGALVLTLAVGGRACSRSDAAWKAAAGLLPALAVAGWLLLARDSFVPILRPGVVPLPAAQLSSIIADPGHFLKTLANTLHRMGGFLFASFVGILGWLDTALPRLLYWLAAGMIGCMAWLDASGKGRERDRSPLEPVAGALLLAAAALGVMTSIYLTYNGVHADLIEGLQGRYFIPIALFAVVLLPRGIATERFASRVALASGAAFIVASLIGVPGRILSRYYGF